METALVSTPRAPRRLSISCGFRCETTVFHPKSSWRHCECLQKGPQMLFKIVPAANHPTNAEHLNLSPHLSCPEFASILGLEVRLQQTHIGLYRMAWRPNHRISPLDDSRGTFRDTTGTRLLKGQLSKENINNKSTRRLSIVVDSHFIISKHCNRKSKMVMRNVPFM